MRKFLLILIQAVIVSIFTVTSFMAQTNYGTNGGFNSPQIIRNTSNVLYSVNNTDGASATFTWTITGGTIVVGGVDQVSPYTHTGTLAPTDSIYVRWNNAKKDSANLGTITVSKVISGACSSTLQSFSVQAWAEPKAIVPISSFTSCSGSPSSVNVRFEGNPGNGGYLYKWRIVKVSDNTVTEDHTASFLSALASNANISIATIINNGAAPETYQFEVTQVKDAFTDILNGDVSAAKVTFTVSPQLPIGPVNSSKNMILR